MGKEKYLISISLHFQSKLFKYKGIEKEKEKNGPYLSADDFKVDRINPFFCEA